MKRIVFFVMFFAVAANAQEVSGQRYQLFQGQYIHDRISVQYSADLKDTSTLTAKDTCIILIWIDTETGKMWYLRSASLITSTPDSVIEVKSGFGWDVLGGYDFVKVSQKGKIIKP